MKTMTQHRGSSRGFTLIELMISLTAGLLISSAAFLLARNASRFFSKEASITTAQFANVIAMTRLSSDLKRSAYAATPNVQTDDWLCGDTATWPIGMQELAGIRIIEDGSVVAHNTEHSLSTVNGLDPDSVIITGAFSTTEVFSVSHIVDGGGTITVVLQNDAPMIRSLLAAQGDQEDTLEEVFRPGRLLRIIEKDEGKVMFGVIQASDATGAVPNPGGNKVSVVLSSAVALPQVRVPGDCGCIGLCTGAVVNPVSRVLYDLRQIDTVAYPGYAPLYSPALHNVTAYHRSLAEATRTDLVRVELDSANVEIPGTLELVAEYGVDLEFGITREVPQSPPVAVPVLQRLPLGHADVYTTAGAVNAGGFPENIRAVQVRLSTRASRQDRDADIGFIGDDGGRLRYSLGPVSATNPARGFARMRTLITEVALMNHPREQP